MRGEKIFLVLLITVIMALVIFEFAPMASTAAPAPPPIVPPDPLVSQIPAETGPQYLQYNHPWQFAPPVGNLLPTTIVGQSTVITSQPNIAQPACEME